MTRPMRSRRNIRSAWRPLVWAAGIVLLAWSVVVANGDWQFSPHRSMLRLGDRGPEVIFLQHVLYQHGYLHRTPDGNFDRDTEAAVRAFQTAEGIVVDGIVGPQTWSALARARVDFFDHLVQPGETVWDISRRYQVSIEVLANVNGLDDPNRIVAGQTLRIPVRTEAAATAAGGSFQSTAGTSIPSVELLPWNEVNPLFPAGSYARVIDVATGKSFEVRRLFGTFHADVEPVTLADTEIMREIVGTWSWNRRPIILEVGGRYFAASMNAQPHGEQSILDNGFPGHFCIHLLGSRTHGTRIVDPDHHHAILVAAGYQPAKLWLQ